jgi:hypothetical protein
MQGEVIGEGCAAMPPWQDVHAPISAVLAAKRLDHFWHPFSSLPLSYPLDLFVQNASSCTLEEICALRSSAATLSLE